LPQADEANHLMHLRALILLALAFFAALAAPASAAYPEPPTGPIYDGANIISAANEAALDARLREYNARTGSAVIVATVPSLDGETVERYATELFETWGIGGAERDTGVLLLVAPNERKVRIEVGYGLHPYITDILSGRIIREDITPRFKQGDFGGGITAGIDAIVAQLERSPEDAKAIADAATTAEAQSRKDNGASIGGVIFWIVLIVFFMLIFGRRGRGQRRRYGVGSAVGDVILWNAIGGAMGHGSRSGWGGDGGGFGGFGGGMSGGGGASGSW
jgi:uncharacterized protein